MDFRLFRRAVQQGWSDDELEKLFELTSEKPEELPVEPESMLFQTPGPVNEVDTSAPGAFLPKDLVPISEAAAKVFYSAPSIRNWARRYPDLVPIYHLTANTT